MLIQAAVEPDGELETIAFFRTNKPIIPPAKVTSSCAILHTMVTAIAWMRLPSFMYSILPIYSPIRLGVKNARVVPVNMALKALLNGML